MQRLYRYVRGICYPVNINTTFLVKSSAIAVANEARAQQVLKSLENPKPFCCRGCYKKMLWRAQKEGLQPLLNNLSRV